MMSQTSKHSIRSPISSVPNEVLREIFVHCLPQYPLNDRQPNTTIAPMLLCQICSTWRTVALMFPTLWSHLFYHLTIATDDNGTWEILEDEMEFLRWWKRNQGSIPPFLSFGIKSPFLSIRYQDVRLAGDDITFLLEYLNSAQYLDLDMFYWRQLQQWIKRGYHAVFPNLHTLVKPGGLNDGEYCCFKILPFFVPNHTLSTLRHLSIERERILEQSKIVPVYFLTLTHIVLNEVEISLDVWFSLIRAVPNLQWGHFDIDKLIDREDSKSPSTYTLSKLTTLSLVVRDVDFDFERFNLSRLFMNLHLPVLLNLSLSSSRPTTRDLYTVLESAPAITTLTLGDGFLTMEEMGYDTEAFEITGLEPIWMRAADLIHLKFKYSTRGKTEWHTQVELGFLIDNMFFSDNGWLDLENFAYPDREITLIIETLASGPLYNNAKLNSLLSSIRENAEVAPNVIIHMTMESPGKPREEERNEWGSRI